MKDFIFVSGILVLTVILLLVLPVAFLWSVNSLFGTGIPYTFRHLLAAWVLLFVFRVATRTEVKN
jgi:hypothetical protein